jgi:putative transposase
MARISRLVVSGYPHHVTQRGVRSIPIFDDDGDRIAYLDFMTEELKRFSVEVLAWCLMTSYPSHRGAAKSWLPKSLTIRTRAPLLWLDGFCLLWACFVSSWQRSFVWQVDRPDLGLYLPCGIGCAAAFVRGVWAAGLVVALVLFFVER